MKILNKSIEIKIEFKLISSEFKIKSSNITIRITYKEIKLLIKRMDECLSVCFMMLIEKEIVKWSDIRMVNRIMNELFFEGSDFEDSLSVVLENVEVVDSIVVGGY